MTKADKNAADRLLTAAVRRAVTMTRAGEDGVEALLTAAGVAAGVLLDGDYRANYATEATTRAPSIGTEPYRGKG